VSFHDVIGSDKGGVFTGQTLIFFFAQNGHM